MTTDTIPAADTGLPSLNRRTALVGLALAALPVAGIALATGPDDAELIRLGAEYQKARDAVLAACDVYIAAEEARCDRDDAASRKAEAEAFDIYRTADDAANDLLLRASELPAATMAGLKVKADMIGRENDDGLMDEGRALLWSIAADVRRLAGQVGA